MTPMSDAALAVAHPRGVGHRCLATSPPVPLHARPTWYGDEPGFIRTLERSLEADVEHRGLVTRKVTAAFAAGAPRILQYAHAGVDVPSRPNIPVLVEFHEFPLYPTYGRHPRDYPRVYADLGAASPHRLGGDALCIYYPDDPPDRTWQHSDGLALLFNLAANHLFFEEYWRENHIWLNDEAGHNLSPAR